MKALIWKIRFVWGMCRRIGFWPRDIGFGWYNATVWAEEYEDFLEMEPDDAVWEEMSCWDEE